MTDDIDRIVNDRITLAVDAAFLAQARIDAAQDAELALVRARVAALEAGTAPTPPPVTGTVVPVGQLPSAILSAPDGSNLILRGGPTTPHPITSKIAFTKTLHFWPYQGENPLLAVTRDGLYFKGGGSFHGINVKAGGGFTDNAGSACLEVEGGHDVLFEDFELILNSALTSRQQGLYISLPTGPTTVRRVKFRGNGSGGWGLHIYRATPQWTTCEDSLFEDFRREGAVVSHGPLDMTRSVYDRNNINVQLRDLASGSRVTANSGVGAITKTLDIKTGVTGVIQTPANTWT